LSDEDKAESLEQEAEAQRGVRRAEDLEDVDRPQPHGDEGEEEVDEVNQRNEDDEHRHAQQRVGQRRGAAGEGAHAVEDPTVEIDSIERHEQAVAWVLHLLLGQLLAPDGGHALHVVAVVLPVNLLPAAGQDVGVGPRMQADEVAVVPVGGGHVPVADIGHGDDVREGAVRGEILVEGHHLVLRIDTFLLLVAEPEDVACMHAEPRGL